MPRTYGHKLEPFEINILNCLSIISSLSAADYCYMHIIGNDCSYFELDTNNDFSFNQHPHPGTPYPAILTSTTLIWIIHRLLVVELLKLAGKKIIKRNFEGKIEFDFVNKVRYI